MEEHTTGKLSVWCESGLKMCNGNVSVDCKVCDGEGNGLVKNKEIEQDAELSMPKTINLHPDLFKDNSSSVGGSVKARSEVNALHRKTCSRPPNMNCRIESFGRICQKFDERRKRWVNEMGFFGLLHMSPGMHLPRQLAYWLMTRIDPLSGKMVTPSGVEFKFSKNQVRWVLGIPNGARAVPSTKSMTEEGRVKVQKILLRYGKSWESKSSKPRGGTVYTSVGIPVTPEMLDRLEGYFDDSQEEEFKTLFLIVALEMVLCPTQSPRLAADLLPALSCAMQAVEYDWCGLVLSKFMDSVSSFARRFYANGYAGGCGGCAIFAVIFYLDRLDRDPVDWDAFPRIKVWNMRQIGIASKSDKLSSGDYGKLGSLDVAYGERHPREARDTEGPSDHQIVLRMCQQLVLDSTPRKGGVVPQVDLSVSGRSQKCESLICVSRCPSSNWIWM